MPELLIANGTLAHTVPLAAATLVGRAATCLARIDDAAVPAHWLEIRWRGDSWAWRVLASEDRTRGAGRFLDNGWRRMEANQGKGTRVALGDISVELVTGGPPEPFLWDLTTDKPLLGADLEQYAEVRGDELIPLVAEGNADHALRDGQCWIYPGEDGPRMLRAHVPRGLTPTHQSGLDLRNGSVTAEVDMSRNSLLLTRSGASIEVRGSCVRAIALYHKARSDYSEGWLTASDAWCIWVDLGGNNTSPIDAVAWERGRLRRLLDRAGVAGLDTLFERRKEGAFVHTRLGHAISRLVVNP
jgi:hypothetical protein